MKTSKVNFESRLKRYNCTRNIRARRSRLSSETYRIDTVNILFSRCLHVFLWTRTFDKVSRTASVIKQEGASVHWLVFPLAFATKQKPLNQKGLSGFCSPWSFDVCEMCTLSPCIQISGASGSADLIIQEIQKSRPTPCTRPSGFAWAWFLVITISSEVVCM